MDPSKPYNPNPQTLNPQQLRNMDPSKPVWVEDEGRMVGEIHVPGVLFDQVRVSSE